MNPGILLIIAILIRTIPFLYADNENYTNCGQLFQCGNIRNIGYPFFGGSRPNYCGHPSFGLTNCQSNSYPTIEINSFAYRVISIDSESNMLELVRDDYFSSLCPDYHRNATWDDGVHFSYALDTSDLLLYYSCEVANVSNTLTNQFICYSNSSLNLVYYAISGVGLNEGVMCKTSVSVRVGTVDNKESFNVTNIILDGFGVRWDANNSNCDACVSIGGRCGSDPSSGLFLCYGYSSITKTKFPRVIIGVSSVIGLLLLIIGLWCYCKVVKKEIRMRRKELFFKLPLKTKKFFKQNGGLLLQQRLLSGDGNVEKIKVFKAYELEKATNNYSVDRVLGQGGQGTVYKGILSNGKLVAIKRSKIVDTKNVGQFVNEIVILSQINHRNIVKLLGCCLETKVPMLVYEFISNGTLYQQIHNPNEEFKLNWEMRLRIAAEIACTLSYLHNAAPVPIYHRDIKSTNILLDDKYRVKVADFGISRSVDIDISHLTTIVRGTFGYLDPEYYQSSRFTEKSDVYSFGVVLVELLTSKKPILSNTNDEYLGLAPHFLESMEENHLLEMIDPQLPKEEKIEEIVEVAHLAKACLNQIGKRRPTMKEVATQLEGIKISREQTTAQENGENGVLEAHDDSSIATGSWSESSTTSSLNVDITSLLYQA